MTPRLLSGALVVGVIGAAFWLLDDGTFAPPATMDERSEVSTMAQAGLPSGISDTGFSYSPELAAKFGLPADDAMAMQSPLLGVAMEIKAGIRGGKVCLLHVLFDAAIDIRLPQDAQMHAIGSNVDVFPNGFLQRPDGDIRQHIATQVGALSNRAIFRNGRTALTEGVTAGDDPNGSYTSMPLGGYHREFVPGVGWLVMSVNCELAAHEDYSHASLFVESNASPSDMILNGHVDPGKMIEFKVPQGFIDGMRAALLAAAESADGLDVPVTAPRFTVINQ